MAAVTLDAAVLGRAMKLASSIVEARQTIPILANVRLDAPQGASAIEIVTTDLDVEFRQKVMLVAPAAEELATTVDARRLTALVSAVERGAQIALTGGPGKLTVQSGRSRWNLFALPPRDFPLLPVETLCNPVRFEPASALARAIDRTAWAAAASTDKAKPYAQGVCINAEAGKVRLTALDGYCLATVTTEAAFPAGAVQPLVGTKFIRTLATLCADVAGVVTLAWDDRKIRAEIGDVTLTGKLIDQTFPDYRRVLPQAGGSVTVDGDAMRAAIRRVQLISNDRSRGIKMERRASSIVLSSTAPDNGDAMEEVPAECGQDFASGFNGQFLASLLDAIGGETVEIYQESPGAAALIRRVVDDGAFGVVMPMRV